MPRQPRRIGMRGGVYARGERYYVELRVWPAWQEESEEFAELASPQVF